MGMRSQILLLLGIFIIVGCQPQDSETSADTEKKHELYKPWDDLGELFHDVQVSGMFLDSKTFVDCTPKRDPKAILADYKNQKGMEDFSLNDFVTENFDLPEELHAIHVDVTKPMVEHLEVHWSNLTRSSQEPPEYSTIISLPEEYIVPGGRFREIYYWDSYFSMIGLGVSGRVDLIESMVDNFAYVIDEVGYIPNGNRTYFLGRSQPPFFGSMVNLYAQYTSIDEATKFLPELQQEYDFWMEGKDQLTSENPVHRRVVKIGDYVVNRYFDDVHEPRPESYKEDVELAEGMSKEQSTQLFLDLRAACESGWDFSARWFEDGNDFASIRTSKIAPIDLNSLMYKTELVLSDLYKASGNEKKGEQFKQLAAKRKEAINALFWNAKDEVFMDILWADGSPTGRITAASFYPMYFKAADETKGKEQVSLLLDELFDDGGMLTTKYQSHQQWDAPNGWAPLQWISYKGLQHYGFEKEAADLSKRWLSINKKVYNSTGKMMEKYNVADTTLIAGGGEYPNQDGFGWTNGIALGLSSDTNKY